MIELGDLPAWFYRSLAIVLGLVWGSFLNVVIYRVPLGLSVVRPASRCPACGVPVRARDNVPVLGWLLLRGRARCCGVRLSPRYPLVEAACGLLAWAIVERAVLTLPESTSVGRAGALFVADLALALGLVAVTFIDLEHMYVPDAATYGGTLLGIATFSLRPPLTLGEAVVGAVVGFVVVWLPFSFGYRLLRGRTGMGLGDAKLVMVAGAWFGWTGALFALLAGAVQGTVVALTILALRGKIDEPEAIVREKEAIARELEAMSPEERAAAEAELAADPIHERLPDGVGQARIAFGPFLALAMLEYLLLGHDVVSGWVHWLVIPF